LKGLSDAIYNTAVGDYFERSLRNEDNTGTGTELSPKRILQDATTQFKRHLFYRRENLNTAADIRTPFVRVKA
jgi:hypothetical protein